MKSIGEHLKSARDEKGFSHDQVVHDTNISREYIGALETDDFDQFPAEAYLIGFLRNYSEYLGLDPSKMVAIYKNFKISEEPVPMDLLLGKKKAVSENKIIEEKESKKFPRWLIPVLIIALIVVGVSFFIVPNLNLVVTSQDDDVVESNPLESEIVKPREFFLTEDSLDIKVADGDKIKVSAGNKITPFNIQIKGDDKSIIYLDQENQIKKMDLIKGDEQVIVINEETRVYFSVIDISQTSASIVAQKIGKDHSEADGNPIPGNDESNPTISAEHINDKIVISTEAYPKAFTIDVFFRGDGLFRYTNDDQPRNEKFYQAGDRLKIDVNRTAILWTSNAGIAEVKISGKETTIGKNGQIVVRAVKWIKNNDTGKYELILVPFN